MFIRLKVIFVLLLALNQVNIHAQCGQLIWNDEFDGTDIDNSKWTHELGGGGWGNNELQTYTNSSANSRIENGRLIIEARNDGGNYTSARMYTRYLHSWQYGKFEMSAKLPSGTGVWPAFWMLRDDNAWPMTGEIDIMEYRGDIQNHVAGTVHYGDNYPNNRHDGTGYDLSTGNFTDDFHTFAIEWEPGEIRWYVDGNLYKTETASPNSLNPPSNNDPWPWDGGNFFLILNVAVGGPNTPYTGYQNPNFGSSAIMEVEYVRVYSSAQPDVVIDGPQRIFDEDPANYSVPSEANRTYNWTVPSDATITSGQGTNSISVDWTGSEGGDVQVDIAHTGGACSGNTFLYTQGVEVYQKFCDFTLNDFEQQIAMTTGFQAGQLYSVPNPGGNAVNSSDQVGEYDRNGAEQYDALIYEDVLLDHADDFVNGIYELKMDVRTDAPIGTQIDVQLGNVAAAGAFPAGTHSIYTATTTTQNQWETLTFTHASNQDPNRANYADALDRLVILFNPNTWTGNTYYFDNIRRELATGSNNLSITGPGAVDPNQAGVNYTVSGGSGSVYDWTVPVGAVITNGQGTNSIDVDFASQGGKVTVSEQLTAGCWSDPEILTVSVGGGSCAVFSDDFDDSNVGGWVTTQGDAGFTYSEVISDLNINSLGHDQWAYVELDINDGTNSTTIDLTDPLNNPILRFRAQASETMFLRMTLEDENGVVAQNQYLNPINGFAITDTYQEYTIDFNGQLWDEYTGGGALDASAIDKIRILLNPAWIDYPENNPEGGQFNYAFEGEVDIDYIRIGDDCQGVVANFTPDQSSICQGGTVTYTDATLNDDQASTWEWDFGDGASPASATGQGPHTVTYSTTGYKTVTLDVDNGTSISTKDSVLFVSGTATCFYEDDFDNASVASGYWTDGNFTFSEANDYMTISTAGGHGEYESVAYSLDEPVSFVCNPDKAILKFRARASADMALRATVRDGNNIEAQNDALIAVNTFDVGTDWNEYEVDLTGLMADDYVAGSDLDTGFIAQIVLRANPGYSTYPFTTDGGHLIDAAFEGDIDIEWLGFGDCTMPPLTTDCNGDLNGSAYTDVCGNCVGGNTGNTTLDSDSDGTPDCNDGCPGDPNKVAPGTCGCGVADTDTDSDGTPDCNDLCPSDSDKTLPGTCGCGVADTDTDSDGTPDCDDLCPSDPGKTAPGTCGCGVADTDSDADGTPDCDDQCPSDPNKVLAGACGCGVADTDSDADGTPNCNDLCPTDPNKIAPGSCGCGVAETDTDSDGTPDCTDECPNDVNKTLAGACGCGVAEGTCTDCNGDAGGTAYTDVCGNCVGGNTGNTTLDSDSDGTPDCNDQCPSDPNKTAPGTCGCGVVDTDSDSDGTPDCNDACPNDAGKISPGTCGCGVADTDSDSDGTPNCNDLCPSDPNKIAPGTCGCGVADTDSDSDGTPDCNDQCPADPNKTTPGLCGCGLEEGNCQDCAGVNNGSAFTDNCGNCVGGTTGQTACVQDCNDEWGGTAEMDVCNQCAGGSTGVTPVTDVNDCINAVDPALEGSIQIYPNPFERSIYIDLQLSGAYSLKIYNAHGVVVMSSEGNGEKVLGVEADWPAGLYILQVVNDNKIANYRIIKR